eukprot:TRINITY_DN7977_c0_g1_i1.p1 TRINITY_DN7977_c0_g1~~TRINITY_DN7977_c0_g1_i1.p1  ORF type:complete len:279 (-),score=25.05 TRINITY_DN7977_c0_g1_i1:4-840(-)
MGSLCLLVFTYPIYIKTKVEYEEPDLSVNSLNPISSKPKEYNLLQSLLTIDFWLLFFIFLGCIGSGIVVVNNFGEIVISKAKLKPFGQIDYNSIPNVEDILTFVALFSVFNTLGRMLVGFLSDRFLDRMNRCWWLAICGAIMSFTLFYFSFSTVSMMYFGVITLGLSYGGVFCMVPILTSELFGLVHFGANWGVIGVAPAVGSELLNVLLAGKLNDHYAKSSWVNVTTTTNFTKYCLGSHCYQYTFYICGAVSAFTIILSFILKLRNSKRWKRPELFE